MKTTRDKRALIPTTNKKLGSRGHCPLVGVEGAKPPVKMPNDLEIRRLRYLARRRSTLELDQVLGLIADRMDMESLSETELIEFARVIELDDFSLQKALLGKGPVPKGIDPDMWNRVLDVIRKGPDIRQMLLGDQ